MSDNIKVVVKVRPLISREIEDKLSYQWRVKNNTLYQLGHNGKENGQSFTFEKVYDKDTNTAEVYNDIAKPIVEAATAGFNGTIFAYGQTSSGKTYTMTGTDSSPGIIPLAVINLFEIIKNIPDRDFLVRVSYIEIYNETLRDLFNLSRKYVKITESHQGIKVEATEKVTSSPEEILEAMKEGEANRQKGATNMNEESSRSHTIFQIIIESREHVEGEEEPGCVNVSQLNLVDLAGSERSGQTGATGRQFIEGTHINKSLSVLALVINQLSENPNRYVNYRDSKLTRILQNSLGGNAKTTIICAITPAAVEETISTLQFANRAKAIKNKPEVNAVATSNNTMIQRLTKQMCDLKAQLESKKNIEQDNHKLQSKIQNLQKLILNGFAQRRSMDLISGPRRKLQQPRRITISAFNSISEEEPVVSIPKFCTPSLKYNPLVVPKLGELAPVAEEGKLSAEAGEPARVVTPPPTRTVFFSNEVIELDSDDDSTRDDVPTCSPIHKCYGATKTPPCVLRRNAKEAERNLKGLIELTEREKMYSPEVIEYIEKLEQNTTVIAKLQDEIEVLNRESKEKDSEMDLLRSKVKKSEEDMKALVAAKIELLSQCDNFNTKLTDAEVSYETLRNKAKLREEELLSLLEELTAKNKKPEDIGKMLSRTLDKEVHFMDISKDISLVNSDSDSVVNGNDDGTDHINELVAETQSQLDMRNQTIIDLEATIFSQKQKISMLEDLNKSLQEEVSAVKDKLVYIENENTLLKSTLDTLNSTIKEQKINLETAKADIDSYNTLIRELQIKLTQKDSSSSIDINDSALDNMIANEEKFIANNENMKNIIRSLKTALESRNKEVERLKSAAQVNDKASLDNLALTKELELKSKEIDASHEKVESLTKQINENVTSIHKLMLEKNVLKVAENELSEKLANCENKISELEKINLENSISNERLKEENLELTKSIAEKNVTEKELLEFNKQFVKQIEEMTAKTNQLEQEISEKRDLISSLEKEDKESKEYLLNAKAAVLKSQLILGTLTGNMQEVPEIIDNFVNVFSVLSNSMNTLEKVANDVAKQKEEALKNNNDLKIKLEEVISSHKSEILVLQEQLDIHSISESNVSQENLSLSNRISELNNELEMSRHELRTQITQNENLVANLTQATENVETCNKIMDGLRTEKQNLDQTVINLQKDIENLMSKLQEKDSLLNDKISEINIIEERIINSQQERDELLNSICNKITQFTINFNIQNDIGDEGHGDCSKVHERILLTLDSIGNHISLMNVKNVNDDSANVDEILLEAQKEIAALTQQNLSLIEQLSQVENKHSELSFAMKKIQEDNKQLNKELTMSQNILQSLQSELEQKSDDLTTMERKVLEWKEQFKSLDTIMTEQMAELKLENEKLKARIAENKLQPQAVVTYEHKDSYDNNNKKAGELKESSSTCSEISSPPSLLTICCNKIVDSIQPKENESKTSTVSSNTEYSGETHKTYIVECKCKLLAAELEASKEENSRIIALLQQMEAGNKHLIREQETLQSEIRHLLGPAEELQKKIVSHKTNLTILTATTNAENKSLKSQVKVLQHHHRRFHNVCQRDLPEFKKQLRELMILLKGDPSVAEQQNASFKRYSLPDVLDSSTALPNFKNESTLDGDLLMLDTNVTITTAADNTLTGQDQTCLDLTQFYNEASCQTNDLNQTDNQTMQDMTILCDHNQNMTEMINMLKEENATLRELVNKYGEIKEFTTDAAVSPVKSNEPVTNSVDDKISVIYECANCKRQAELQQAHAKLFDDLKTVTQELTEIKAQKSEIEEKYNYLVLETPSTDILIKKLNSLEKDCNTKIQEIAKLNKILSIKTEQLKSLQDENDTLSTQVFENVSEADDLNRELDNVRKINTELLEKCSKLEQSAKESNESLSNIATICSECITKDERIKAMEMKLMKSHSKLNRSLSDSDTSSRFNKIVTLQSELHAGREECKEITEDVASIKNHLDRSNLAMDLDDSLSESNIYPFTKDYSISSPQSIKCTMPDIPEERTSDIYVMEKIDCLNYYVEKTGFNKDNVGRDIKIIDLMKTFYEHLITQHGNEVQNLTNKLKDFDESKSQLEIQICSLIEKHSQVATALQQKDQDYNTVANTLSLIKQNIHTLNQEVTKASDIDINKLVNMYKDNFFKVLDKDLGFSSMQIIDALINNIVNKHQTDLTEIKDRYTKLQEHMENVTLELKTVNENLAQMKEQLAAKESEYNLLKAQKERIHQISNAVTLDIIKRDKELTETLNNGYNKLMELNIVNSENVDMTLPANVNVSLLFDHLINKHKDNNHLDKEKEKENLALEVKTSKQIIEEKQKEIEALQSRGRNLQEINNGVTIDLVEKQNKLQAQNQIYESQLEENKTNVELIKKMEEEIQQLRNVVVDKENTIEKLEMKISTQVELIETVKNLQNDISHLKSMNDIIVKEKDSYSSELVKSGETLKQNSMEMDRMTSDILVLRESVRENTMIIDNLNTEVKNLLKQNMELKGQLEEKSRECFRLETNMKTHEKTAEIQSRMIMRLEKQKNEDDSTISEKSKLVDELKQKCAALQKQCDSVHNGTNEIDALRKSKETLEARVIELETQLEAKSRPSIDAIADSSRRRRQSLHDSKRLFGEDHHELGDHSNAEAIFESRAKPDDLFMDVDDDISNRSSPIMRLSKGRDSLSLSRTDQEEEHPSRPSSVVATRRRRQSIHDLHRSVLRHTPSPHGMDASHRIIDEINHSKPSDMSGDYVSEMTQLKDRLSACQQELEELKEKYRELDDECETCAEYLRERDLQCARLKKEKTALQATVSELKEKLQSCNPAQSMNQSQQTTAKPTVSHVGVNTDEDWTNLHSVVVDRMSFDAEVEKNKRLTKTIEELRFKKQDLKNTLAKMQKALEKNTSSRELESTRHELQACKHELAQLRQKYKDLDEECDTCAQYLREKEEQCRRLKEAKNALEMKLHEYQGTNAMAHSTRKKRQSLHDQNRSSTVELQDASTETCDDFLSNQVERDARPLTEDMQDKEVRRMKLMVEKLSQQKALLEQQLVSMSHPMYVATGSAIVQNQQLTDVMKENQKLKKINAKLVNICKKRGKDSNRENEDPAGQG
ncbi:kinesin-related protein 4-like isoform X1 [Helicoverpa zea]|uniref:kinesin-related protein 4-like isoform X1 n=1 Tax=Helicoverpa zea TaxID=7113 RepID=UPI001F5815DB|nr:kinesin-related protein 4-like isoform X1 [Helicoverpa zea]